MARVKRTSDVLDELKQKLSGMVTIDPKLDLGNGITVENAEKLVTTGDSSLKDYNTTL
ncbi:hypothetical protein [uncultured Acetobacteroides sp.]|uniref:hypothetical protein n=1 Tax=uncultured Acetobacteroides sp. TaxID=1760811 RepID=UPI0029F482E7|nr:hypothetical protein [uncultured Acetobacteroides sp.]